MAMTGSVRTDAQQGTIVACPHCAALNRVPADKPALQGKCGTCGSPLFTGKPVALTVDTAARHWDRADIPVLVDFWAAWCGPCRAMAPVLEQAARTFEPALRVAKVDTESQQGLAARFGIRAIPTLILMHKGQEIARQSGAVQFPALKSWVSQFIDLPA